ncbi:MFS transporter [Microbispora hainanensis]|uniref:MFS transporter n=1 Tax=Microbispora hainanensis TaxID=568844 RepID=A0A544YUD4_9ACTN|nr:MFS transporter [Microbispora hainanensis]TQS20359.1 MFS transporter [Microbispora hainanensis]
MTTPPSASPVRMSRAAVVALGLLAISVGSLESVVSPTLPLLQRELGMSPAQGALLNIMLLITGALITPIAGTLGDRYGGKRVLIRLMAVVSVGGLTSALAPSLPVLLVGQILQGAMLGSLPLAFIVVRKHLPTGEAKAAIGLVSGMFVGGSMVGLLAAGPVAESLSRHWMFALPTFAIIGFTLLVSKLMPADASSGSDGSGIDWPGLLLLSGTLSTLMLVLALAPEAGSAPVVFGALVVVPAAFAAGWIAVERRAVAPMIDLRMLARPVVWKSCVVTFVICLGTANGAYLVPQLLDVSGEGYGFGASPTTIGLVLLPGALAATLAGPIGGIGERRLGPRTMTVISTVMMAFALLGLSAVHGEIWHIVVGKALIALAIGLCVTAMMTSVASSVDEGDTGIATSVLLVTRALGSAVGAMLGGALLTAHTVAGSGVPAESGFVTGFLTAGITAALCLLVVRTMHEGVKA